MFSICILKLFNLTILLGLCFVIFISLNKYGYIVFLFQVQVKLNK